MSLKPCSLGCEQERISIVFFADHLLDVSFSRADSCYSDCSKISRVKQSWCYLFLLPTVLVFTLTEVPTTSVLTVLAGGQSSRCHGSPVCLQREDSTALPHMWKQRGQCFIAFT